MVLSPAKQKTWNNFKTHFADAYNEYCTEIAATASASNYGNNVATDPAQVNPSTFEALENVATATAADCYAVANLTTSNQRLSTKLQNFNAAIDTLQSTITAMQQ